MLSGIKQQVIVGKDGKIEIQTSAIAEGTVVEVIVLVEQADEAVTTGQAISQEDATAHLLSTEANRYQLMSAIQSIETRTNLVSFTPEEWDEEYNLRS